ncbi:hypothetical protein JOD31_000155 [Methylopila capsulata]|uniref:Glycosyl transferase family 2 n=1 Tax=Methylopila capsulata TaxID=61654 RepID=A0A9W6ITE2_9HYPH|nr:hypothetical protein [Methylopila capsulata]MBM7849943.1 hypothetical protein [Methylopila capsulata]GLK55234.1 hypothetical protein GCM10008170_12530 [Methylopila capsulata]
MSGVTATPVDVAILCRGTADVKGCAASVRAQGLGGMRMVIISDGGENDHFARDLAASRPDLFALPHNDASTERRWATGAQAPFLLTLSAGQRLVAGAIDAALALMTSRPDVVAGCSRCAEAEETALPTINDWRIDDGLSAIRRMCGAASAPSGDGPVIVRAALGAPFGRPGGEGARLGAWLRLSLRGAVAECAAPLAVRAPAEPEDDSSPLRSLNARREAFAAFFRTDGRRLADAAALARLANLRLAQQAYWAVCAERARGHATASGDLLRFARRLAPAAGPRAWGLLEAGGPPPAPRSGRFTAFCRRLALEVFP